MSREERRKQASQISDSVKARNRKFEDTEKKRVKQVITSIMRRAVPQEEVTHTHDPNAREAIIEEEGVAREVIRFYTDWMHSRSGVLDRWESREAMMDMGTE